MPWKKAVQQLAPICVKVTCAGTVVLPVHNHTKKIMKPAPGILMATYEKLEESNVEEYSLQDKASCRLTQVINDMVPQSNGMVKGNMRQEKLQTLLDQTNWGHLEANERRQLFKIIQKHHPLFILEEKDLGLMKTTPAHILVADPTPCRSVIYRYPDKAKEIIKGMIENMKRKNIIEN